MSLFAKISLLFILALLLFTIKIGTTPILDGDTAYSAVIARNIIQSGNWITLQYLDPKEIICKPPMFYWMIASGFKLFGVNEFGLSFFHSILAALTVVLTYFLARQLTDDKTAWLSAWILLTGAQFFYQARSPLQDVPLTLFVTAALCAFIRFERSGKYFWYYLVPVFTALAVLIKGPVGLVLVGLIMFFYLLVTKKLFKYLNWHLLAALLVFLLVAAPWFVAAYQEQGDQFIKIFVDTNLGRYFMPTDQTGKDLAAPISRQYDFWTLPLMLLVVFIPWSGFLYPALFRYFKQEKFLVTWVVVVIGFFSLSLNYKIGRYILPAYPALAILVAKFLTEALAAPANLLRALKWSKWIYALVVLPAVFLLTLYFANFFPQDQLGYQPIVFPALVILSGTLFFGIIFLFFGKIRPTIYVFVAGALAAYLVLIVSLSMFFPSANPIKRFCQKINQRIMPAEQIYLFDCPSFAPFAAIYLQRDFGVIDSEEEFIKISQKPTRSYFLFLNAENNFFGFKDKNIPHQVIDRIYGYQLISN